MEIFLHSNLKFFREKFSLSQQQIADLIEKKKSVIGHYERGTSFPPLDSLVRISTFFGITLDNLTMADLRRQDEFILKFLDFNYQGFPELFKEPEATYENDRLEDPTISADEKLEILKNQLKKEREEKSFLHNSLKNFANLQGIIMRRYDDLYYSRMK